MFKATPASEAEQTNLRVSFLEILPAEIPKESPEKEPLSLFKICLNTIILISNFYSLRLIPGMGTQIRVQIL